MSTLSAGLFCVTTKGRMACPEELYFSSPPGRIESFRSTAASALRIASGFNEPALPRAATSARTVS